MRVVVVYKFYFKKSDYLFITKQLKSKRIKISDLCKELEITRQYFHDLFSGKRECPLKYINHLKRYEIVIPYDNTISGVNYEWEE